MITTLAVTLFLVLFFIVLGSLFQVFRVYVWPYLVKLDRWWQERQREDARRRMAAMLPAPALNPPQHDHDAATRPYVTRTRVIVEHEERR